MTTLNYEHVCLPLDNIFRTNLFVLAKETFGSSDPADGNWRIDNMPDVTIFVARDNELLVGFKMGYAVTSKRYYSWLGGVHPDYRRQGIARELMDRQHQWISNQAFAVLETEIREHNDAMADLNASFGFRPSGRKLAGGENVVIFRKRFSKR